MSNENHNNFHNWKGKLEGLESLPGETMPDKNALFEKINARLQSKKYRKKPMWYWISAACVLFVFMIPLMIPNNVNHQLANTDVNQNQTKTKQDQPEKQASVATANHKKDSITIETQALSKKNVAIIFDKKIKRENKVTRESRTAQLRLSNTVSMPDQLSLTADKSLQVDTSYVVVSTVPAKKKLRVVHINELGYPPGVLPQVARNLEKPSFHFLNLGSQEVYDNPSVSVTKNFATINFKTSPN